MITARRYPARELDYALAGISLTVTIWHTRGFRIAAPTIWNSLPANVRSLSNCLNFPSTSKITHFLVQLPHCLPGDPSQRL